jgi:hypothetical protein
MIGKYAAVISYEEDKSNQCKNSKEIFLTHQSAS